MRVPSGYPSPLYAEVLACWTRDTHTLTCSAVGRTRRSGLQGAGAVREQHHRTECLWLKPGMLVQDALWEAADDLFPSSA